MSVRPAWVAAVVALLLSASSARAADASHHPIGVTERAWIASQIHTAVSLYFAHWEAVPELDLEAAFRAYLDEALAAPDRRGFDLATMAFIAQLRNGHSGFTDEQLGDVARLPVGFRARPLGSEWVVTTSRVAGVRPGDVVRTIDGEPIERFYARSRRYLSASSEREARRALFWARHLFPAQFTVGLDGGRDVAVDRTALDANAPRAPTPAPAPRTEGRWIESGAIAYVRVPSWGNPSFEDEALRLFDSFRSARAMVIDVRGNGGGNSPIRAIRRLMERPWRAWSSSTPMTVSVAKAYREILASVELPAADAAELRGLASFGSAQVLWPGEFNAADAGAYEGKIVLLVDGDCASACEDFVVPFKDNHRATIVGEATWGSSGQPFTKSFGNGMSVRIGAKRERMPDGSPFEGVGITPDVAVEQTAADVRAGRDPALDAAVRLARGRGKRG